MSEEFEAELTKELEDKLKSIMDGKEEKDLTDEQKQEILKARMEAQQKKIQQFDTLVKQHEPVYFNSNVFKTVKLVMTDEELKAEEQKVKDLAAYLKEHAIENLIKNFQKQDGTPCDSASMSEFFHQNGVNMRYLGMVADIINDKNLVHMKYMLEREVIVRCVKHLLNKYIRECQSEELLGATVSHVLNCLLAPKDFVKRMDEKQIQYNLPSLNEEAEINLL